MSTAKKKSTPETIKPKEKNKPQKPKKTIVTTQVKQYSFYAHLEIPKGLSNQPTESIHPTIIKLGYCYLTHKIIGSNQRCYSMLEAFLQLVKDFEPGFNVSFIRHFLTYLSPQINYLKNSRPLAMTMSNAIRYLKQEISNLDPIKMNNEKAKESITNSIKNYMEERIKVAKTVIAEMGALKIVDKDVLLVYSNSSTVYEVIKKAKLTRNITFRVIVADSGPLYEGKKMLEKILRLNIQTSYIMLNTVGYMMSVVGVNKVFLGAHAVCSNSALFSRSGTALVAMSAHQYKVPVILCSETYKFTNQIRLDSFVYNEIGYPHSIVRDALKDNCSNTHCIYQIAEKPEEDQKGQTANNISEVDVKNIKILNLLYDLTPGKYISMIITEVGMIPCTSVPVVVREYKPVIQ